MASFIFISMPHEEKNVINLSFFVVVVSFQIFQSGAGTFPLPTGTRCHVCVRERDRPPSSQHQVGSSSSFVSNACEHNARVSEWKSGTRSD